MKKLARRTLKVKRKFRLFTYLMLLGILRAFNEGFESGSKDSLVRKVSIVDQEVVAKGTIFRYCCFAKRVSSPFIESQPRMNWATSSRLRAMFSFSFLFNFYCKQNYVIPGRIE